jgi:hypothetical protein
MTSRTHPVSPSGFRLEFAVKTVSVNRKIAITRTEQEDMVEVNRVNVGPQAVQGGRWKVTAQPAALKLSCCLRKERVATAIVLVGELDAAPVLALCPCPRSATSRWLTNSNQDAPAPRPCGAVGVWRL